MIVVPSATVNSTAAAFRRDAEAAMVQGDFGLPKEVGSPPPPVIAPEGSSHSPSFSVPYHDEPVWSHSKEGKYSDLATKRALGEATENDQKEFKRLQNLRRRARNSASADEIIFQYKRRQMEARLLVQLQEYANFIGAASITKA